MASEFDQKAQAAAMQAELDQKQQYAASRGFLGIEALYDHAVNAAKEAMMPAVSMFNEAGIGSQVKYTPSQEQQNARAKSEQQRRLEEGKKGTQNVTGNPDLSLIDRLKFWDAGTNK